jgi:hypothetical protein
MSLLGLAIIGKSNEPLYLCDCDFDAIGTTTTTTTDVDVDTTTTTDDKDRFGFVDATRARGLRDSLSLERQFMMHAALDRLEEITGAATRHNNSMVGRNMTVTASSPHWMGLLTRADDELFSYGYVTATNIKFLALIRSTDSNDNNNDNNDSNSYKTAVKQSDVQKFLAVVHEHYITYLMNPFSRLNQPIDSRKFDQHIQAAVRDYQNSTTV